MSKRPLPLSLAVVSVVLLAGCELGFSLGPPDSPNSYPDVPAQPEPATQALGCNSTDGSTVGDATVDFVGTWQDWTGGTDQLVRFESDGTVSVWAFPPYAGNTGDPAYTWPDETQPPVLQFKGRYALEQQRTPRDELDTNSIDRSTLTVTWDDGQVETISSSITSVPGCTMLVATSDASSRLPGINGDLERVTCSLATAPGATPTGTLK